MFISVIISCSILRNSIRSISIIVVIIMFVIIIMFVDAPNRGPAQRVYRLNVCYYIEVYVNDVYVYTCVCIYIYIYTHILGGITCLTI